MVPRRGPPVGVARARVMVATCPNGPDFRRRFAHPGQRLFHGFQVLLLVNPTSCNAGTSSAQGCQPQPSTQRHEYLHPLLFLSSQALPLHPA